MDLTEEVIDATLEADGTLRLSQRPQVAPGPVRVTIRAAQPSQPQRTLADVLREIMAGQQARGFVGRSAEEIQADFEDALAEDEERDQALAAARRPC